jgi:protein-tyrosine phosphatase
MAEFVFKDLLKKRKLENKYFVSSSATSSDEIYMGVGNPVYPPAREELKKHGIYCEGKRAVQLKKEDYGKYDLFVCMDNSNVKNTIRIFSGDSQNKVKLLLDYVGGGEVADPWYYGHFDKTYDDIFKGCTALLEELESE